MEQLKLFMLLLGCRPPGRNTEQHDVYFGIGHSVKDLVPEIKGFWPEAKGNIHIDAWREVTQVNGYSIHITVGTSSRKATDQSEEKLFFLNLGGYKQGEFDEFHYKMLVVSGSKGDAMRQARQTNFYKHTGYKGAAAAHIDDKYGVDVDDLYEVKDILPEAVKQKYSIRVMSATTGLEDELHLGFFRLHKL